MKIDITKNDFGLMCICSVRYALGRRTYMPSEVIRLVIKYLDNIDENTLYCIERDVRQYGLFDKSAYGDECDQRDWLAFQAELKDYLVTRYGYRQSDDTGMLSKENGVGLFE